MTPNQDIDEDTLLEQLNNVCHGCGCELQRFYYTYKLFDVKWIIKAALIRTEVGQIHFCVSCDEKVEMGWPIVERVPSINWGGHFG